ncbi:hypothetical protein CC80DRAFT_496849 [Byssothecium circinans]|uniref:Cation chloride cotransporter-like protein n=1 Tax=Byssothecium circinans TaxID=147558 RepID=A0A6A5TFI1_9PLEO|nr:hypothetical protein CC80DRAFT_496849 [Byssothecium circinans]
MDDQDGPQARRRMPPRSHSNFATRTAADESERLNRRGSILPLPSPDEGTPLLANQPAPQGRSYDGVEESLQEESHGKNTGQGWLSRVLLSLRSKTTKNPDGPESKRASTSEAVKPRPGAFPRPVGGTSKLGTFAGVFVPTTLNVLSILMFLRFGFILGQTGVVGMMGMLVACYIINLLTTMSISAIATNGTVRGGGAYYLISRSLGPEFGGSIGIVFYLGLVFNTSLNAVGLIDCFIENFGSETGGWSQWMPQGFWWQFLWSTTVLLICTAICLAGSSLFARCSNGLLVLLLIATFSIPLSALVVSPFSDPKEKIVYTGLNAQTFRENLMPHFTRGAAGGQLKHKQNFQDMFGILFPATGGIFAGASMSGDLKHPSKAIPKGTLYGLGLTFVAYTIVIFAIAATVTRESLYSNTNVIQLTNISGVVILLGEFATAAFSVLMGVIGSAKLLQALARDHLLPGLSAFGQGTQRSDDPTYAIFLTYLLAQLTMLSDINQIASFITMTYLMTFLVTNLACFLLKIGSAPNFRPSFHFFNWQTAALGAVLSGATMYFVDGVYASACVALLIIIFLLIHYTTPPKPWGDVSQSLIYHQVRKYLLRLRQEHVKFWRPQILLLVNDPRRQFKLIQFCNSLKKGALFVLGHVIVSQDFGAAVPEVRQQQQSWTKYIDFSKIKAFVNIAIAPTVEWGARNILLGAGLGGMRPNIVVMGFYNLGELRQSKPLIEIPSPQRSRPTSKAANHPISRKAIQAIAAQRKQTERLDGILPTDAMRPEHAVGIQSYVTIVEDLVLRLQINVALAKGFQELEVPTPKPTRKQTFLSAFGLGVVEDEEPSKKYIDMWPIQMSAEIASSSDDPSKKNVLTTNFDTYTLILQLGCILHTVPSWKRTYKLRVIVFVEYETDVEEERGRVTTLLRNLRIEAEVLVFWLASGSLKMYEVIINGRHGGDFAEGAQDVDNALEDEEWWSDIQKLRRPHNMTASQELANTNDLLEAVNNWPTASFQYGRTEAHPKRFQQLRKMLKRSRKTSLSNLQGAGVTAGMRTQRLPVDLSSESSSSSDDENHHADDEAITTESEVTGSDDRSEYDLDASDDEESYSQITPVKRSKSTGTTGGIPFISQRLNLRQALWRSSSQTQNDRPTSDSVTPLRPHPGTITSDSALPIQGKASKNVPSMNTQLSSGSSNVTRPPPLRQQSLPKFTSNPTPRTQVASEEASGPSIMFVESPTATRIKDPIASAETSPAQLATQASVSPSAATTTPPLPSSPLRNPYIPSASPSSSKPTSTPSPATNTTPPSARTPPQQQASGFPHHASIPLSFNDLPCRAQHLILNELIRSHSDDTAVVFTTLPAPVQGTSESEPESVKYVSDLEVLCLGLPPCLLVHSNSMTVTMNL